MKTVLITAGPVYGKLDDNKLVSNRSRGLWVTRMIPALHEAGYQTVLVVPDIMEKQFQGWEDIRDVQVVYHSGYDSYAEICYEWAAKADAAIMAAAVVNYIPKNPYPGKMPTDKKEVLVPFVLAPRVIDRMREINPSLTLIGCKLLFSDDYDKLIEAAYHVVLRAKCNVVVANDGVLGLRQKYVVHQDRAVVSFDDDFEGMYKHLIQIMEDEHWKTIVSDPRPVAPRAAELFDRIVDKYRDKFQKRVDGEDFVFGSVCVRMGGMYLVSPREKGHAFTSKDAVVVKDLNVPHRTIYTYGGKATLNAPLLVQHLDKYPRIQGVVHWHAENRGIFIPGRTGLLPPLDGSTPPAPVMPYAPPGTVRDSDREIPGPHYFIDRHGWILAVDGNGEIVSAV